jgi:hypothetical protein
MAWLNATQCVAYMLKILHALGITEESGSMKEKPVLRFTKIQITRHSVLLRVFSINENGDETWVGTSSPIHKLAATEICRMFERPITIMPPIESLQDVFEVPGGTAWSSATASDAQAAALQACFQHDIQTAQGVLVMVTLSAESSIVASLKSVLNAIHQQTPSARRRVLVVGFDKGVSGRVRVDVLALGLQGRVNRSDETRFNQTDKTK